MRRLCFICGNCLTQKESKGASTWWFSALGGDSGSLCAAPGLAACCGLAAGLGSPGCPCCGGSGICVFVVVLSASWRAQAGHRWVPRTNTPGMTHRGMKSLVVGGFWAALLLAGEGEV